MLDSIFGKPSISDNELNSMADKYDLPRLGQKKPALATVNKKATIAQKMPKKTPIDTFRSNAANYLTSQNRDQQYLN